MNDLTTTGQQALLALGSLEKPEVEMLQMPQVSCPVVHHFGPGIAIREVFMPAGTLAIGHKQKFEHLNIMLRGKVMVVGEDGMMHTLSAPLIFVGKPGRKIGYVLEDMIWQNVYATNLKNADEVEAFFIEKSEDWQADYATKFVADQTARAADRADYAQLLTECGISHETARQQSEDESDQIWVDSPITRISDSPIEGKGLFVTAPVKAGDIICPARIGGMRTQAGRFTNHSVFPNAKMIAKPNGDIDLIALIDFEGCKGGEIGIEATIDYRQALALSGVTFERRESLCQA